MHDRVLLLSVTGDPGYGAERVLATLLDALPRDVAGRLALLRPPRSSLARWAKGTRATHADWTARRDTAIHNLIAAFRAGRALRHQRIGLVHAWGGRAFEPALLLGRLLGARVAGTLHDHPRAGILSGPRRALLGFAARRLRPLVCVSHALAQASRDAWGVDSTVLHNGLPAVPPAAAGRASGPVRVGFFGLYAPWKGFETVRRWIEELPGTVEWHLYGEPAPALRAACEALRARRLPHVVFHGWVDEAGSMDQIDVLVHASTEFDPYPTVLLEAARAGIPAVASDVGGAREIVEDGVTGSLFPPPDPGAGLRRLTALAADAALRARMGVAARRRFEAGFGVDRMVREYVALWNSRLSARR